MSDAPPAARPIPPSGSASEAMRRAPTPLEQIGTEVDCAATGRVVCSAWYELVPAGSQTIRMKVKPGDSMSASVSVNGHRVVLSLIDATSHKSFRKVLNPSAVDVASAEWILEAPSSCAAANLCQTLPLADFGSAAFTGTRAQAVNGHLGTISDRGWDATRILLRPTGRQFIGLNGSSGTATASALNPRGNGFTLAYSSTSAARPRGRSASRAATVAGRPAGSSHALSHCSTAQRLRDQPHDRADTDDHDQGAERAGRQPAALAGPEDSAEH